MLYFYFYQLLTAFNNIKIMSEVTHDTGKRLKLFTNSIDLYLIEETAALNASTEPVKTMGCDSWFHSGADTGFQVRGAHLKKLHRAEGSVKIVGVFRVKNHDFTPKNHIFSNFRGGGGTRRVRLPLDPPLPFRYHARKKRLVFSLRLIRRDNEISVIVSMVAFKSVLLSNRYILIHHDKLSVFMPVFKTAPVLTLDVFGCLLVTNLAILCVGSFRVDRFRFYCRYNFSCQKYGQSVGRTSRFN
jgi:hypothetical protein